MARHHSPQHRVKKESLTLKTLFWVVGDGVTTVERYWAPALCMSDLLSVHLCVSHLRSSDALVSDQQLPGIRINSSNRMSSIQRFSSIIIDKDNAVVF